MFFLNYFLIIGTLLSIYFASAIQTRKDIVINKIPITVLLYLSALSGYIYMTMTFNANTCSKHVWVVLYLISTILFIIYFIYYIFDDKIKNVLAKTIVILGIVLIVITISMKILTSVNLTPSAHITIYQLLNIPVFHTLIIVLSLFTLFFIIAKKRYYLIPVSLFGLLLSAVILLNTNLMIVSIIYVIYYIYLPIGCYKDFIDHYHCKDFNVLYNINAVKNMDFGVIYIDKLHENHCNRFIQKLLKRENDDFDEWVNRNKHKFDNIEYNIFKKIKVEVGKNNYYFFILKQTIDKHNTNEYLLFVFDTTRSEILERMSERYNEFLSNETAKKIYSYNYQQMLEDNRYFLRGFSHNSFNLISVITTGMQYLKETMNEIETLIFSSGSLGKKRNEIHKLYYNLENTLRLTDSGVNKIQESFRKLSSRIGLALKDDKSIFSVNEGVKQEMFFYIENTMYQYSINKDIQLDENDRDINMDYNAFATIMHDILKFMLGEIYEEKNPTFYIKTKNNKFDYSRIELTIKIKEFDKSKIDNIVSHSIFNLDEHYAPLINAFLVAKTHGMKFERIDDDYLTFRITINE